MNIENDPDSLIGEVIASRYRIEARVGDGAMGTVYRARHVKVGRPFAIKVLRPSLLGNATIRRRFLREAELAGALHHPNIVGMVDMGQTTGDLCYLVMEYAPGDTLYDLIVQCAPMPAGRVIAIVRQLCDGLAHAHDHGLIHRDFKPENVVVERSQLGSDSLKIIDFGIAILLDEAASSSPERLTTAGLVLGTPHYMAPEQALGQPIDHRVDLFALGVMCFEMLTGKSPYDGDGVEIALANVSIETPAMSVRAPDHLVDPLLEAFTRKLMMKSRDARPASAAAARALLDLIECDRVAAAAALDVVLPSVAAPAPARAPLAAGSPAVGWPSAAPRSVDPRSAVPVPMHTAMPHAPFADERAAVGAPEVQGEITELFVRTQPRRTAIALAGIAAIATFIVIAALISALRTQERGVPSPAPAAPAPVANDAARETRALPFGARQIAPAPAPTQTTPVRTATRGPAPRTAAQWPAPSESPSPDTRASPEPVDEPHATAPEVAPIAAAPPPVPSPTLVELPAAAPPAPTPAAISSSAAGVADLYVVVGRTLKALDDRLGSAATADLWLIYLRIRINDVIADPVKCHEADVVLHRLHQQILLRGDHEPSP